jgi:DNA-binding winged helix-turn-helix (wHTH) protein
MTRVSFDTFVFDSDTRELRCGEEVIALSPKAFHLLEVLVASQPNAVSKTTLQECLWPDTFVVEKNLVNLIAEIRAALGDDPAQPRYVRTVRRFGYAFRVPKPRMDGAAARANVATFCVVWSTGRANLSEGEHVLGRDPEVEIFLDSPSISRRHALIKIAGDSATVEDLNSRNGTFVAGRRLAAPARLTDGDIIRLGPVELTFHAMATMPSTRTDPVG